VKNSELRDDPVQLRQGKAVKVIETFPSEIGVERFDHGVLIRGGGDAFYTTDADFLQHFVKAAQQESAITVVDHEPWQNVFVLNPHGDVSDLLFQPNLVRVIGGGRAVDAAALVVDDDENERF